MFIIRLTASAYNVRAFPAHRPTRPLASRRRRTSAVCSCPQRRGPTRAASTHRRCRKRIRCPIRCPIRLRIRWRRGLWRWPPAPKATRWPSRCLCAVRVARASTASAAAVSACTTRRRPTAISNRRSASASATTSADRATPSIAAPIPKLSTR